MKIGVFSDSHIGPYGDKLGEGGINARLLDYQGTVERMVAEMGERGVELVLFAGDAFKTARPDPALVYHFGQAMTLPLIAIPGNHDLPRVSGEANALSCVTWRTDALIRATPELLHYNGIQIITLPYPNRQRMLAQEKYKDMTPAEADRALQGILVGILHDLAEQLQPGKPSILLAHLSLDEAAVGSESSLMYGRDVCIPVAHIPDNIDWCFFGHVHKPQRIQLCRAAGGLTVFLDDHKTTTRVSGEQLSPGEEVQLQSCYIVGSIESVDFGEEGEEKRWLLLDTAASRVETIPTGARKYITYHMDVREGEEGDDIAWDHDDGAIVRLKVKMNRGQQFDLAAVKRRLLEQGAFSVKVEVEYDDQVRLSQKAGELGASESHEDVLRAFCRNSSISEDEQDTLIPVALHTIEEVAQAQ